MLFDVLSSGSKGNATLVLSGKDVVLLDFGISKKRIQNGLLSYGLAFSDVEAFFLTHGHDDHVSDAFNAPIEKVFAPFSKIPKKDEAVLPDHLVKPYQVYSVGSLTVKALPMSHDFKDTMAYVVDDGRERLCYVTDTGFLPEKDIPFLKDCDYILLESNHDPRMLYESKRPDYLIRRIISDKGHLSNVDCASYLSLLIGPKTKEVVLLHLSEECNTAEKAKDCYEKVMMEQLGYLPDVLLKISSAKAETKGGRR